MDRDRDREWAEAQREADYDQRPLRIVASQHPGASHCWRIEAPYWTLDPVSEETAAGIRGRELDTYLHTLEARGEATVIQVEDLGAALEARDFGEMSVNHATGGDPLPTKDPLRIQCDLFGPGRAQELANHAAHLARKALGEVTR